MTPRTKFYGWKLIAVLWALMFVASLPMYSAGVINAYMASALHFDRTTLGIGFAIYQLTTGIPGVLAAVLINRRGIRFTMTMGAFLIAVGALLMATVVHASWEVNIVFGFIVGIGVCAAGPIASQTAAARWFVRRKALAMSLLLTGGAICGFVAPPLANWVVEHFHGDWRSGWWLLAILNFAGVAVAALFVREKPADLGQFPDGDASDQVDPQAGGATGKSRVYRTTEEWTFGEALRSPVLWLMLFSAAGFCGGFFMFLAHGVVHLKDLGHSPAAAAFSISILSLSLLFGTLLAGALGDRFEPRLILAGGMFMVGVGLLLALKAASPIGLYTYAVFLGGGSGIAFTSAMALPANFFGVKAYASIIGLSAATGTAAAAVADYAAGYIYDHFGSYSRFFITVGVISFVGCLTLLLIRPPKRKVTEPLTLATTQKIG
jgi:MFS family permease